MVEIHNTYYQNIPRVRFRQVIMLLDFVIFVFVFGITNKIGEDTIIFFSVNPCRSKEDAPGGGTLKTAQGDSVGESDAGRAAGGATSG